mgnify:FL=1
MLFRSEEMLSLAKRFGSPTGEALYEVKCPMAFDNRGAIWLQDSQEVRNPYFGKVMLRCGEVQEVHSARTATRTTGPTSQPRSQPTGEEGHSHE